MKIYNTKEIADLFGVDNETVRRWIRSGELKAEQSSRKQGNIVYEKEFGDRVGEEITNNIDLQLFERIKDNLDLILLAKHYVSDRLSSEFNTFVM